MEKQQYIEAGRITNTHGVAGEVKIEVWLDSPQFMKRFQRVYIDGKPVIVRSSRVHKQFLLCSLEGVEDVNAAMTLKNKVVYFAREDAKLPAGRSFIADLIGARVVDEQGAVVGELTEVLDMPAGQVYVVQGETEHTIPAVPEFVLDVDADNGLIRVHLIEGM